MALTGLFPWRTLLCPGTRLTWTSFINIVSVTRPYDGYVQHSSFEYHDLPSSCPTQFPASCFVQLTENTMPVHMFINELKKENKDSVIDQQM